MTKLKQADISAVFHPQTDPRRHEEIGPLVIRAGEGVRLWDAEGRQYVDAMASLWCANLGFNDPRLAEAASQQMQTLATYHCFNHRTNGPAVELAAMIRELAGWHKAKVFFTSGGSEANDTMVKFAWYYHAARGQSAKRRIISRQGAFHGSTVMGAALSGLPHMHRLFNLPDMGVIYADPADSYRGRLPGESDGAMTARMAAALEAQILREDPATIAAMILEPVMGAGGVLVPPDGYFAAVEQVLRRYDILMLCDEVVCGFGRSGEWFGHQTMGANPDMMSTAKALTSGYVPMGAVVIRDEIYQRIADAAHQIGVFGHGFTYSAHPVMAAVALKTLQIYHEMDAPRLAADLGAYLGAALRARLGDHPHVGDIRRCGFVAGVEIVARREGALAFDPSQMIGRQIEMSSRERGLILRNMGDVIALCPPLIVTKPEIDWIVETLAEAIDAVCGSQIQEAAE